MKRQDPRRFSNGRGEQVFAGFRAVCAVTLAVWFLASSAAAQSKMEKVKQLVNPQHPDALDEYLKSVRGNSGASEISAGSLWKPNGAV
jgi:hypothetical protein